MVTRAQSKVRRFVCVFHPRAPDLSPAGAALCPLTKVADPEPPLGLTVRATHRVCPPGAGRGHHSCDATSGT